VDVEPLRVSVCHCHACQRRTGSVLGAQAWFPRDRVTVTGTSRRYRRVADTGNAVVFHFCPNCGSTVFYEPETRPEMVGAPVGAFADATFPPPTVSIYEARMHPWVGLPTDIEHHE
jgi:hypothetical protein